MRVLLDTSTLVAAMLPEHVHNATADAWLTRAKAGAFAFFVSGHSAAEIYSVLTRMPRKPRLRPADVLQLLNDNVFPYAQLVSLNGSDYVALINDLSQRGLAGGVVYDAVISKAAELAQVDQLVTLNTSHFQRVWPAGAGRIISAHTPPP
jgi:predicted nucleic acid-binding protein